jgi:tetratricopeptide (TPR) repeat protein
VGAGGRSDRLGEANARHEMAAVGYLIGDYPAAVAAQQAALGIYRDIGDPGGQAEALNEAGTLYRARGSLDQAEAAHRAALALARTIASTWDEAHALAGLGRCAQAARRTADARAFLRQAQEAFREADADEAAAIATELSALAKTE